MAHKPPKKKQGELAHWFSRLVQWLKGLFGLRSSSATRIKSRRYSIDRTTALFTLERDTIGATETWRLTSATATGSLLVTLDNLPDCRAYYKSVRDSARKSGRRYVTTPEERALSLDGSENHTHRFSFSYLDWQGQKPRVTLLGVWDGDFAGFGKEYSAALRERVVHFQDEGLKRRLGNVAAVKIGEMVAKEILEMRSLPGFFWDERIRVLNYEELLKGYCSSYHGNKFDAKVICRTR